MHPRRRKKRAAGAGGGGGGEGGRTVTLRRGESGFGFTISGQQPCILSCIVPGSNADVAGLRAGNFLISVNGVNVSKSPHDSVVQLIGGSSLIDVTIADNYYSDSSEEECVSARVPVGARVRPKHVHKMKTRPARAQLGARSNRSCGEREEPYHCRAGSKCAEGLPSALRGRQTNRLSNIRVTSDVRAELHLPSYAHLANVDDYPIVPGTSSGVRGAPYEGATMGNQLQQPLMERESPIECRVVIGYLGTIEMPKQIATSSKLQTVRSCIRKLRQEKRSSTTVLMTILPSSMTLKNSNGVLLAEYACRRINYVSCMSENDYRYFGLVTAATHIDTNENIFSHETDDDAVTVEISHSCHVFTIDPRLIEHADHALRASEFRITCTLDPVTNHCLEFPTSADYIVNIIRLMYSLKFPNGFSGKHLENISRLATKGNSPIGNPISRNRPPLVRGPRYDRGPRRNPRRRQDNLVLNPLRVENIRPEGNYFMANSPQPSNHSEITTTSSNSDSGIGFHNDCQNLDRILVVDFANPAQNFNANVQHIPNHYEPRVRNISANRESKQRPLGIIGPGNFDMDSSFLSNTTPVVEGFGGQGQPLNHENEILPNIGEVPQSIFNANIMNISSRSKSNDKAQDHCAPCHSRHLEPSVSDQDKLNARVGNQKYASDALINIKCHYTDDSSTSYSSTSRYQNISDDLAHYDPVYTEPEDHHYEMIKPLKDGTNYVQIEDHFKGMSLYNDCYPAKVEIVAESLKSNDTESFENITVISTKSCDYVRNRQASVDDISVYSSRSHENPTKVKRGLKMQSSVDDILMFGLNGNAPQEHAFLHPANVKSKLRKPLNILSKTKQILSLSDKSKDKKVKEEEYKLSASVFGGGGGCASVDNLCEGGGARYADPEEGWVWGGAQLEGARSEPDLRSPERAPPDQLSESEQSSPFRRWTSGTGGGGGGAGAALGHRSYRRPGSLVASSDHDMFSKCTGEGGEMRGCADGAAAGGGSVSRWSLGLDQLLADPAGSAAFAAFLAKEFSAENIKFWWECERYRSAGGGPALASQIWSKHLTEGAREPVNVDSHARLAAQRGLQDAPPDLFAQAQKQIFTLMKFDSYPRFLQSDIHAECARAELLGQPSPYLRPHTPTPTKLKKSLSNAEERRRGSLLPWARLRGGSKERPPQHKSHDERPEDQPRRPSFNSGVMSAGCQLCRVMLPDSATSIVAVDDTSVRQVVDRLLEKRAIRCSAYDVIVQGDTRPVDVTAASSSLAGKEVAVERRIVFRLELPGRRPVSVRTRPNKLLAAVLRPALDRYALSYAEIRVTRALDTLPLDTPVQDVDGARLQVHLTPVPSTKPARAKAEEPPSDPTNRQPPSIIRQATTNQAGHPGSTNQQAKPSCHSLDEITNRVFEEVLQGKAELQVQPTDNSMKSDNCSSEHSSSAVGGAGRSVVAKLRAGVHLHTTNTVDSAEFLENLRQTQQRLRLQKLPELSNCGLPRPRSPTREPVVPPVPAARSITKPCPAVRTSLTKNSPSEEKGPIFPKNGLNISPISEADLTEKLCTSIASVSTSSESDSPSSARGIDPPPLPPKPKVLPTKPSNWGNSISDANIIQDVNLPMNVKRMVYLDQPTSSFV